MANTKFSFGGKAILVFENTATGTYAIASYTGVTVDSSGKPTLGSPVAITSYGSKAALTDALHAIVRSDQQES